MAAGSRFDKMALPGETAEENVRRVTGSPCENPAGNHLP
jgi:hypothetical protein